MLGRKKKRKKKKDPSKQKRKATDPSKLKPQSAYDKFIEHYFPNPVYSSHYSKADWNDFMYEGMDLHSPKDVIELISDYAEGEESFDIYQLCAFDYLNDSTHYKASCVKALLCLMLQLPSIIFIIYGEIQGSEKGWCNNLDSNGAEFDIIVSKCLAFGYSLYVSFYIEDYIQNKQRGMRCIFLNDLKNKPSFLNGTWLRVGGYYNDFSSYVATIASYMIIFVSESQIDLVLNALALFFLIEVDDLLVGGFDYHKIFNFINDAQMRACLGFGVMDSDYDQKGVRVTSVKKYVMLRDGDLIDGIYDANGEMTKIETKAEFVAKYEEMNLRYSRQFRVHVSGQEWDVNIKVINEEMRDKIGFNIADRDGNGVLVHNSGKTSADQIVDGDIIDGISVWDDENDNDHNVEIKKPISSATDFDAIFDGLIESAEERGKDIEARFSVNRNGHKFTKTVVIVSNAKKNKAFEKENCTANDVWAGIYKFVDLPVRFAILILKWIAPFFVGICS